MGGGPVGPIHGKAAAGAVLAIPAALLLLRWPRSEDEGAALEAEFLRLSTMWCSRPPLDMEPQEDLQKLSTVHVVYASDRDHFGGLLSSMASLSRHLSAPESCSIHVLVRRAHMEGARSVIKCFEQEVQALPSRPAVTLHELRPFAFNLSHFLRMNHYEAHDGRHATREETYARLYLQEYLPTLPRALWIDTDTIVRADVGPLYRMRMQHALAAVPQPKPLTAYLETLRLREYFQSDFFKPDGLTFFNAGVLLLDLQKWKAQNLTASLEEWVRRLAGIDNDQLALNLEFHDKYDPLDWRWNSETLGHNPWRAPDVCRRAAWLLHWSGPHKPWNDSRGVRLPNDDLWEPPRFSCEI